MTRSQMVKPEPQSRLNPSGRVCLDLPLAAHFAASRRAAVSRHAAVFQRAVEAAAAALVPDLAVAHAEPGAVLAVVPAVALEVAALRVAGLVRLPAPGVLALGYGPSLAAHILAAAYYGDLRLR